MTTKLNRDTLYSYLRRAPFGGRLTQAQIDGVECILKAWDASHATDWRWLAYIFATAFHETGGKMQPVREGFAKSDAAARGIVSRRPYGKVVGGQVYYGRGLVQLTWSNNYKTFTRILGLPLFEQPDLALDPKVSAVILVRGMIEGLFTGKRLDDYFNGITDEPRQARRIVNRLDKADLIAGFHASFIGALTAADEKTPQPQDVAAKDAEADAPALTTDKTVIGTVTSVLGAGAAGVFAAVDNPWALAAFGVALIVGVIGVWLFMTGRLEIRRQAGA